MIPGTNTLLVGAIGSGKTHSLRTLLDADITPFILFTEPNGIGRVSDLRGKLHYKYLPPAVPEWSDMIDSAKKINTLSFEQLAKLRDINKMKYGQFIEVLQAMNAFTCDCCGTTWGDVSSWGPDRALCIDSLSGLNIMAMDLVVGSKPTKAMADWGVAMDNLERIITRLTTGTKCHFILTAHLEREQDEITGGIHLMASTLGRKLAPKIPRFFDNVVQCVREGDKFTWSTSTLNVDTKACNLPWAAQLPPTFVTIINDWKAKGGNIDT